MKITRGPAAIDYLIAAGIVSVFLMIMLFATHKFKRERCDHCGGSGRMVLP